MEEIRLLVSFQFPIADVRPFGSIPTLRLSLPDWPEPQTSYYPQFVNYFGKATERRREPDEAWPDEIKFVKASRGLRFNKLEICTVNTSEQIFHPICAYRRLFCDGRAVVRMETGIAHNRKQDKLTKLSIEDVLTILRCVSELPTNVLDRRGVPKTSTIISQGKNLAHLYAHASMNRHEENVVEGYKLVEAGDPMILIELEPHEIADDLFSSEKQGLTLIRKDWINGANALFFRFETSFGAVPTWILQKGSANSDQLRSLRICLSRLHAEREVLDLVLKQIHRRRLLNPPTEEIVDMIDDYFNERTKIINRESWAGIKQSGMAAAFDATSSVIRPAIREQLIRRYEGGRLQVWKKIESFQQQRRSTRSVKVINIESGGSMIERQVNVSGTGNIVNVADYMSDVKNTVNNNISSSSASDEVISLVDELTKEIERISNQIDPVQLKKLGKNVQALSSEVASEEPDKRWYEVSIQGIVDAAKAVGDIAEPVIKVAEKLSLLLLV